MSKKCIICGAEAGYCIKGTSDYYCEECALEHFGDLCMLIKVDEVAHKIKSMIEGKQKAPQEEELDSPKEEPQNC
ncbi:MAG: hypothetical protein ACOCZ6_00180 [Nanoarchaeota archaeon]